MGQESFLRSVREPLVQFIIFFPAGKPMPVFGPRVLTAYHSVGVENRMRKVVEKNKERKASSNEICSGPLTNVAPGGYFFYFLTRRKV